MNSCTCRWVSRHLPDYADSELPQPQMRLVAEHLAACVACRGQLERLRKSLELANLLWAEALTENEAYAYPQSVTSPAKSTYRRSATLAVTAACAAALLWFVMQLPPSRKTQPSATSTHEPMSAEIAVPDVQLLVEREGIAAQLLFAADSLAEQPGGRDIACERYRRVATWYPKTKAGLESCSRLAKLCPERNGS